jgi:hypothetical protein
LEVSTITKRPLRKWKERENPKEKERKNHGKREKKPNHGHFTFEKYPAEYADGGRALEHCGSIFASATG